MNNDLHVLPVIEVRSLAKSFTLHQRHGVRLPVLDDFSMEVHAGECVALVGASGRGKSTLMKCLYGSYGCDAGSIVLRLFGQTWDFGQAEARTVLALRRHAISHVSQFLRTIPRVGALDVVAERLLDEPASGQDTPPPQTGLGNGELLDDTVLDARQQAARRQAGELLARLNVPQALWPLPPSTFSGGEQQRVNIARGFIRPTPVLLLDEPTASLDAANRQVVVSLILEARARGTAIVGIFHDEEVREAVATRRVEF